MKLYTFPYAFGTDAIYNDLTDQLSSHIKVENLNYPGHGKRIQEKLLYSIESLAEDAVAMIKNTTEPYALLGYSMGARVCCEIMKQLYFTPYRQPEHVFLLASPPPSVKSKSSKNGDLTMEEAKDILRETGQTPKEVIESDEIMNFVLPMMQADIKALEYTCPEWAYSDMNIPITIINGTQEVPTEEAWQVFFPTEANYECLRFEGDHFFLFNNAENVIELKKIILGKLI